MTEISVESLKQQILQISNPLNIITLRQESPSLYKIRRKPDDLQSSG